MTTWTSVRLAGRSPCSPDDGWRGRAAHVRAKASGGLPDGRSQGRVRTLVRHKWMLSQKQRMSQAWYASLLYCATSPSSVL
ncbi:serine threonine-protein kinase ppk6 [Alternaria alternata]|nr:serine threonine-protein kinase ppk6 [Alternaria alternata]